MVKWVVLKAEIYFTPLHKIFQKKSKQIASTRTEDRSLKKKHVTKEYSSSQGTLTLSALKSYGSFLEEVEIKNPKPRICFRA